MYKIFFLKQNGDSWCMFYKFKFFAKFTSSAVMYLFIQDLTMQFYDDGAPYYLTGVCKNLQRLYQQCAAQKNEENKHFSFTW